MAYDEELTTRVRDVLAGVEDVTEKRMFGGLAFLVDGHLAVSVSGRGGLLVRIDPEQRETLLAQKGVEPFRMRGRPMTGWLHAAPAAVEDDEALTRWVTTGLDHARTL